MRRGEMAKGAIAQVSMTRRKKVKARLRFYLEELRTHFRSVEIASKVAVYATC
jgi:hypothetical protein